VSLHAASVPDAVRAAYGWTGAENGVEIEPLAGGLINATFRVCLGGTPFAVVQRLHPVFGPRVNEDLDAVTTHLAAKGLPTPRLIRTTAGAPWVEHEGTWRALTWVAGTTVHRVPDPAWAEAGGELVGRFHRAVADLSHDYAFARAGVHDTAAHLAKLASHAAGPGEPAWNDLAREILDGARALPSLPETPRRHCHGDLKISNLLFHERPLSGHCLLDLDTLGLGTMAFELGDAMRSWCNPRGEDVGSVTFDLPIFTAAMRSFRAVAGDLVSEDERRSIVIGLETVCFELAARFCVDVFADSYFGWDPSRFGSRREHNLVRARGQLALGTAVRASRDAALDIVLGR
jgi:Ser/Thr protein kinase RdoA (MazF antagonist)